MSSSVRDDAVAPDVFGRLGWFSPPPLDAPTGHRITTQQCRKLRVVPSLAHPPVGEVVSVNAHRGELSEHIADGLAAGHPLTLALADHH